MNSDYLRAIGAIAIPNIGGIFNAFQMTKDTRIWSNSLIKPKLNPPGYVFGPVWTVLYSSMGYASYIVWREGGGFEGEARVPLIAYAIQLAINLAWPILYFKYRKLGASAIELGVLTGAVGVTTALFYGIDKTAGYIMIPYLAWCSFASYLCTQIWRLNKGREKKKE